MTDIVIDGARALQLLEQIVEGKEDFVYERAAAAEVCVYAEDGCPSCLVGQALSEAGLTIDELTRMDYSPDGQDTSIAANRNIPVRLKMTPLAVDIFGRAQGLQDMAFSWGAALSRAKELGRVE